MEPITLTEQEQKELAHTAADRRAEYGKEIKKDIAKLREIVEKSTTPPKKPADQKGP
jgi:hypothetical protein